MFGLPIVDNTIKLMGAGAFAFHPTLEWIFVGDRRGTLLAWDVSTERPIMIGMYALSHSLIPSSHVCVYIFGKVLFFSFIYTCNLQYTSGFSTNYIDCVAPDIENTCYLIQGWNSSSLENTSCSKF